MSNSADSLFSKIIRREIPATIRYEDDEFLAFNDIHPKAPEHVLIVTKEPFASLEAIDAKNTDLHAKILLVARKVAALIGIEKNYKIAMNVGPDVQMIQHLHVHLMGGWNFASKKSDAEQPSAAMPLVEF
jgi:histidine triad (HIT) family protein